MSKRNKEIQKSACIDVDGVLAYYEHYTGEGYGPPNDEGLKLVRMLKDAGYRITIQTCRTHPRWGLAAFERNYMNLVAWLTLWKVPYDEIDTVGKALAHVYIDDRAVHFPMNHGPAEEVFRRVEERLKHLSEHYEMHDPQKKLDEVLE